MQVEPQAEHRWLTRLVGDWRSEMRAGCEDAVDALHRGTERVRSLGGLWILAEGQGEMPDGGSATMVLTLGFDPARSLFVGSWVGSMMTHLWVYEGRLDAGQHVLTLTAEGPDLTGASQGLVRYQDVIEIVDDDHRVMTSHLQRPDGSQVDLMRADYWRS